MNRHYVCGDIPTVILTMQHLVFKYDQFRNKFSLRHDRLLWSNTNRDHYLQVAYWGQTMADANKLVTQLEGGIRGILSFLLKDKLIILRQKSKI